MKKVLPRRPGFIIKLLHAEFFGIRVQRVQWHSGRAWDSESRGHGFDPKTGLHVVYLSKAH